METDRFKRYKKELLRIIHRMLPGCKVILFGSRARNEHDEGADIDIALDNEQPIEIKIIGLIYEKIENSTIPVNVDLVDIHAAGERIKEEIKNEGILWEN